MLGPAPRRLGSAVGEHSEPPRCASWRCSRQGALAATASVQIERIFYTAEAGEVNNLTISSSAGSYTLSDAGVAPGAGPGCTASDGIATCPADGIRGITVRAGDGSRQRQEHDFRALDPVGWRRQRLVGGWLRGRRPAREQGGRHPYRWSRRRFHRQPGGQARPRDLRNWQRHRECRRRGLGRRGLRERRPRQRGAPLSSPRVWSVSHGSRPSRACRDGHARPGRLCRRQGRHLARRPPERHRSRRQPVRLAGQRPSHRAPAR